MTQLHPYLQFQGNCREAMNFYKESLGGELTLLSVEESPMANEWPAHMQKNILHASLTRNEWVLLGSDIGGADANFNNATVAIALNCSDVEELKNYFFRLSVGGSVSHQLHTFFAGTMGTITDRFGIDWQCYSEAK